MKAFLTLLTVLSVQAQAQSSGTCSSIWLFNAQSDCTTAVELPTSGYVLGGTEQHGICASLEAETKAQAGVKTAQLTSPTPVAEKRKGKAPTMYNYTCSINVTRCKASPDLSYQVGGSAPAGAKCLSCDGVKNPDMAVACLKHSITEVINKRAELKSVELRDTDIAAVRAQAAKLLNINKNVSPIPALANDLETLMLFDQFSKQQ